MKHLDELTTDGNFQAKIQSIIQNGQAHGYDLVIHNARRSWAKQLENVKNGVSKTMRSKHLPGVDDLVRAVDIVIHRKGWNLKKHQWVMIGRLALTQGCKWGGLWGLKKAERAKFRKFLLDRSKPFDPKAWKGNLGWDAAHIESKTCKWDTSLGRWNG